MPADIFGARFFGYRQPAWHRLGQVSPDHIGATEALRRIGPYDVTLEPTATDSCDIIRLPTPDDARRRNFGTVRSSYVLLTPAELTAIWDASISRPVETMGVIRRGQCLFVTIEMNPFDVRGDAVRNFMVLAHWMSPSRISTAFVTPVRVVCSNTLLVAERVSHGRIDLTPTTGLRERLASTLKRALLGADVLRRRLQREFGAMADRPVTRAEAQEVVAAAYPDDDGSLRRAALDLFDGRGMGMNHPAVAGTAWGVYNAVAELENFRDGGTDAEAATSVLFGSRATVIRTAYTAARDLYQRPSVAQPEAEVQELQPISQR